MASDRRIVFVAGLHRSGTSLLYRLLASHANVSGIGDAGVPQNEGQHLQSVYPPANVFGGAGRFGFHPAAYMDENHPLATPQNADQIFGEWAKYWDPDAPVLIEKSPPNIIRTRFLQALFPNSIFIVLLRHPIAVACATEKWRSRDGLGRLLEHWVVCHERFERDRAHLHRHIEVRYEELVADPDRVLGGLWRELGLEPAKVAESVHSGVNQKYFESWEARRRGLLSGWRLKRAIRRLEPRVQAFGYSLHEAEEAVVHV